MRSFTRIAIWAVAIGAIYWAGNFLVPSWQYAARKQAIEHTSYALLGLMLLIPLCYRDTIRWAIIGAAFGFLAPLVGFPIVMLVLEPERSIYLVAHHGWQSVWEVIGSTLGVSVISGAWISGALAGTIILILQRATGRFDT